MKKIFHSEPWPHCVYDNFFSKNLFDEIRSQAIASPSTNGSSVLIKRNTIDRGGNILFSESFSPDIIHRLFQETFPLLIRDLDDLSPGRSELVEKVELNLVKTPSRLSFPIHDDHVSKILSVVVYIYPQASTGTYLYSSKNSSQPFKEAGWVPNRALVFSRERNKTWHSYSGDGRGDRCTLVYNLVSSNFRKVLSKETPLGLFFMNKTYISYKSRSLMKSIAKRMM